MKRMKRLTFVAVLLALGVPLFAASSFNSSEWKADFAKHWAKSKDLTMEVAQAMPADGYSYIPPSDVKPVERTFGGLMKHIGQANTNYFGRVAGMAPPKAPEGEDKDTVIKYLNDSYDFCAKALDAISDEQLDKMVGQGDRALPGRDALWSAFTHTAHTRGQAEVYLRLKNVKPPDYRF
jgi:uncharacterized damage-inducible protein DinB